MDAEARREELADEFERSFGPMLFALVVSLPLGLAFAALWGDFRLAAPPPPSCRGASTGWRCTGWPHS